MIISKINIKIFLFSICFSFYAYAGAENKAAIATAHPLATYAGFNILEQGGNAFDAAVAVSAVLAVVEPASSGLGGGGFWLIHRAKDGFETMIDGREKAPLAAHQNMYLDAHGQVIKDLSKNGALAAGIPGLPAALAHLAKKYGKLSLSQSLQEAIYYAKHGFVIGDRHRKLLKSRLAVLQNNPASSDIFLKHNQVPKPQTKLLQLDLSKTLNKLARFGNQGFYAGEVADLLLKSVRSAGGIWTQKDLSSYKIIERKPITGEYRGSKVTSATLPSSGGITLIQTLNILSGYALDTVDSITRKHIISEAKRRAYHDRARYLGDTDFVDVPVSRLLNQDYASGLRSTLRLDKATPSHYFSGISQDKTQGTDTTHFGIIDKDGNRVSATLSINFPFGSGFVADGTGVLLNNEMDDFVVKPGIMNGYGLVGGQANSIAPAKRMLSSMSPTFIENKTTIAVLGTPGGSKIISMVLLAVLDFIAGNEPKSWVGLPRFHQQYIPDQIEYEQGGFSRNEIEGLILKGHKLKARKVYGNMQAILFNKQTKQFSIASDPRGEGLALSR